MTGAVTPSRSADRALKRTRPPVSPLLARWGRPVALAACLLTLVAIWLGLISPLPDHMRALETVPLVGLTMIASLTLFLGPGLAMIHLGLLSRRWGLGLAIVPGILLTAADGLLGWVLASHLNPHITVAAGAALITVVLVVAAALPGRSRGLDGADWAALALILLVLLFGVARGTYSLGPAGDLYGGTISQTLEASNRSDSRISYMTVVLVANGQAPYGSTSAESLFAPYSYSSRGPISGLAATPIVLISGAVVPMAIPGAAWQPFDQQGFAAFRIAMATMAALALLVVYSLGRLLRGSRAGLFALLLATTTPFVVHEVYFTWPKLLAAAGVLLAAQALLLRRPALAGVFVAFGYLSHPLALTALPGLLLLWVIVAYRAPRPQRRLLYGALGLAATIVVTFVFYAGWQVVNGPNAGQSGTFLPYVTAAANRYYVGPGLWTSWRLNSLLSTLVPMFVFFNHAHDWQFTLFGQPAVNFFEQYWTSVPFAVGIFFSPLYVYVLARAFQRDWAVVTATVIVPFLGFLVYWGGADTGLMREGLHAWLLGTLLVYTWARRWTKRWPVVLERVLLVIRVLETLALAVLPTTLTIGKLYSPAFRVTDLLSLLVMAFAAAGLIVAAILIPSRTLGPSLPAQTARRSSSTCISAGPTFQAWSSRTTPSSLVAPSTLKL